MSEREGVGKIWDTVRDLEESFERSERKLQEVKATLKVTVGLDLSHMTANEAIAKMYAILFPEGN